MNEKNIVSRRELIDSAVASGFAAVPSVSTDASAVDLQESDNIVFLTTEKVLATWQIENLFKSILSNLHAGGSRLFPCILHGA